MMQESPDPEDDASPSQSDLSMLSQDLHALKRSGSHTSYEDREYQRRYKPLREEDKAFNMRQRCLLSTLYGHLTGFEITRSAMSRTVYCMKKRPHACARPFLRNVSQIQTDSNSGFPPRYIINRIDLARAQFVVSRWVRLRSCTRIAFSF